MVLLLRHGSLFIHAVSAYFYSTVSDTVVRDFNLW